MVKKAKVQIEIVTATNGFELSLQFTNGQKRSFSLTQDNELFTEFAAYGAKAKLLAAANSVDEADSAVQKVDALIEAFDNGKWSLQGEGQGKYSPLMHALAELKNITIEAAEALVKGMSKSTQAKLRGTERVAAIIARIKAKEDKDGDSLLDSLIKADDDDAQADSLESAA